MMSRFGFLLASLLFVQACTGIVVKVGKKEKSDELQMGAVAESAQAISIRDLEFFLTNLDGLKSVSTESFLQNIQNNWRSVFRREFRELRNSIIDAGERKHEYYDGVFFDFTTEDCTSLDELDFRSFRGFENLGTLLEGSFIANLSYEQAQKLNPDIAQVLDVTSNIVFFELGMQVKGLSEYSYSDNAESFKSRIVWKVDPEVDDLEELKANDDIGVELSFTRGLSHGSPKSLTLELKAARGLYNDKISGPLYKLEVFSEWNDSSLEGLRYENTVKISKDDEITYSRQFLLEQSYKFSPVYLFRDTVRYQLAEEQSRQVLVDLEALEKCALERTLVIVPGVIGMDEGTAEKTLSSFSFEMSIAEDRTGGGDPSATVSAQTPRAGTKARAGSEVRVILDYPTEEDPFSEGEVSESDGGASEETVPVETEVSEDAPGGTEN